MNVEELIKALPKAEQHVHIVGSTRPETLLWLIEEGNVDMPFKTVDDVRRFFQYRDFPHFISVYSTVVDCITREDQFERLTYEMLERDAQCNVRYVEASFSAPDHVIRGLDYNRMLDAINRGIQRANDDFDVECNLRIDVVRNYGAKAAKQVLDWIENKNDNVVAIDLGGGEEQFPPKPFASIFRGAKEMGLHLVAHAGEAAGAESVWDAVKYLRVERVGHGVAAARDSELLSYLAKHDIAIEACPVSNVRTGVISSLEKHPIRTFMQYGIKVSVNSDDPSMFDTDMNNEYLQLYWKLHFTIPELFQFTLNAVDSSFVSEEERVRMHESLVEEYQRLMSSQ